MNTTRALFASLALGTAAVMVTPEPSQGFALLGHQLGLGQRDFRIFNNFADAPANDNQTPHPDYPGATGAVMAIWKACVEWGSEPHGTGTGDATQSVIGSGTSNFEPSYQGLATGVPGAGNVHAPLSGGDGSVFAFMSGGGGGWVCRYYEVYTWSDGPGFISGAHADIQGIAAHEYGHALGLDHGNPNATMGAGTFTGNINERSINNDDRNGLIAIYGAKDPAKPIITGLSVGAGDTEITITGTQFSDTDNEVWFTNVGFGADGDPVKVTGVDSTNGGTEITLTIPAGAGKGDVLVKKDLTGAKSLSNAWPMPVDGPPTPAPTVTSTNPTEFKTLTATNELEFTLSGTSLSLVSNVLVDGVALPNFPTAQYDIIDDAELQMINPVFDELGAVDLTLESPLGDSTFPINVVPPDSAVVRIGAGNDPEVINTFFPDVVLRLGGKPGDILFLFVSPSEVATSFPGLFDLDIGDAGLTLFYLGALVVPEIGWTQFQFQLSGLPPGTNIFFQTAAYDTVLQAPAGVSNVGHALWTF